MLSRHIQTSVRFPTMKLNEFVQRIILRFGYVVFRAREGYHYVPTVYGRSAKKLRDIRAHSVFYRSAREVVEAKTTGHFYDRLYHLYQAVENITRIRHGGEKIFILEAGVHKGGTSHFLAALCRHYFSDGAAMYSVDTFTGHDARDLPHLREGKRHVPGLFSDTSFESVRAYLSSFPFVEVLKGRIQDIAPRFFHTKFHLVHLDMDIEEPTKFALSFFGERMASGGIIIVDDYGFYETSPGVEKTVEEYCGSPAGKRIRRFNLMTGQCLLVFP